MVCGTPLGSVCRFRLRARFGEFHHAVSGPRHIEPDRRISRIRLTAEASSIGAMGPFSRGMLSRSRTPRGSLESGPVVYGKSWREFWREFTEIGSLDLHA